MAYKTISGKTTEQPAKDISSPIAGSLVSAGNSEVTIKSLTKRGMKVAIQLSNSYGESYDGLIFILDRAGQDLSFKLKSLISSASKGPQELTKIYEDLDNDNLSTLLGLTGKSVGVRLSETDGYKINRVPDGLEADGKLYKSMAELKNSMMVQGRSPSYINITEFYRLERDEDVSTEPSKDFMDEFLGASTTKTTPNKTTNQHKSPSKVDNRSSGPDTTGWL